MAGLLEAIFGHDTQTIEDLRKHTGNDRDRAPGNITDDAQCVH